MKMNKREEAMKILDENDGIKKEKIMMKKESKEIDKKHLMTFSKKLEIEEV
jgi:hypothetical protein